MSASVSIAYADFQELENQISYHLKECLSGEYSCLLRTDEAVAKVRQMSPDQLERFVEAALETVIIFEKALKSE